MAGGIFYKLGVWLGINTVEYQKGLDDAEKSTRAFNANVKKAMREGAEATKELKESLEKGAIALTLVSEGVREAFKYAKEIKETADAFDITIQSLLGLQKTMDLVGKSSDDVTKMLSKVAVSAEQAKIGNDQLRDAFTKLGISGKEVETLGIDDLFLRITQQLANTESATTREALAMQLLGKSARATDWKAVVEDYKKVGKSSDDIAEAIKSASEAWENLYTSAKTIVQELLVLLKPLADMINHMADGFKDLKQGKGSIDFGTALGGDPAIVEYGASDTGKPEAKLPQAQKGGYKAGSAREATLASALANAKEVTKELIRQANLEIDKEKRISEYVTLSKNELELKTEINRVTDTTNKNLADTEKQIATEKAKNDKTRNEGLIKELEKRKVLLDLEKDYEIQTITAIVKARQDEQEKFMTGWDKAFTDYKQSADTYADVGKRSFQEVTTSMTNALETFVETGKLSFSDLIRTMITGLLKLQVQYASMQMFSAGASGISAFVAGAGGLFGGTQQGPTPDGGNLSSGLFGNLFGGGKASGGSVSPNQFNLVGENGPELFIPTQSGTIIPNNQISNYMGNSGGVTYNGPYIANLSAIDTQSATQFLANNKQAVWSANISAQRGLPTSR